MKRLLSVLSVLALSGAVLTAAPRTADGQEVSEIRWILTGVDVGEGGRIRCALYRDAETWLDTNRRFRRSSAAVRRGQAACVFRNLPPGTYAMAALHDADGDHQMATSAIGLPREGYAISRDEHDRTSRPDFNQAAVRYEGGSLVSHARMRY